MVGVWRRLDFWLGVLTTLLVVLAWSVSIVSQPLATAFGCSVAFAGMGVAYVNYRRGRAPMVIPYLDRRMTDSLLAVLAAGDNHNAAVIDAAIAHAHGKPVVFLYLAEPKAERVPQLFEVVDPYLEDESAKATLKQAALQARKARLTSRFVYRPQGVGFREACLAGYSPTRCSTYRRACNADQDQPRPHPLRPHPPRENRAPAQELVRGDQPDEKHSLLHLTC